MKKIILSAVSVLSTLLSMNITAANLQYSPFTDNLTIKFVGISSSLFTPYYQPDNGIDISGPTPLPKKQVTLQFHSTNKLDIGYPALSFFYEPRQQRDCTLIFVDGPYWPSLSFKGNKVPTCDGITFSNIVKLNQYHYQLTITKK